MCRDPLHFFISYLIQFRFGLVVDKEHVYVGKLYCYPFAACNHFESSLEP